ncbi:hypothetical protein [Pantoea ananatis]|uniref:hypothetical protein n=1 Tax=Pantoea ananas TaxID=553 RepID=UPI001B304D0C|nr:hypothetical protein [Pantoea ananatis]
MDFIPKLTRQRISELPKGTPIRIGNRNVIFDCCRIEPNYKGEDQTFVYYIDKNGQRHRHFEWLLLESATEFIESELCEYCARFRHPSDIKRRIIRFWNRSEALSFCSDKGCANLYQQTIRVPAARQGKPRRRIS